MTTLLQRMHDELGPAQPRPRFAPTCTRFTPASATIAAVVSISSACRLFGGITPTCFVRRSSPWRRWASASPGCASSEMQVNSQRRGVDRACSRLDWS